MIRDASILRRRSEALARPGEPGRPPPHSLWRRSSLVAGALCLVLGFFGFPFSSGEASAHVVMGTKSLHLRVAEAELVVRARVVDPDLVFVLDDGRSQRSLVSIEVLETLKGKAGAESIRFAQDGHAVARYQKGQEALFFLVPIAKSRELRRLASPGGPTHVSHQEHDETFVLAPPHGSILLEATRGFAKSESAATGEERVAAIRKATLDLLLSGDPQLGASALASLVMSPHAALVGKQDLPRLEKFLADPEVSIGLRAGLVAELDRRGLVDGASHRLALLRSAHPSQLASAIRALGTHAKGPVKAFLLTLLADPTRSVEVQAEAAIALGSSRDATVVAALAAALEKGAPRLRRAAIRGLGQLGGPEAHQALAHAAAHHADPATRERAAAELRAEASRAGRGA